MRYVVAAACLLLPVCAHAELTSLAKSFGGNCAMQETATMNINFNSTEDQITSVQSKFDSRIADIQKLSKQAGVDKLNLTSMSYSVSAQNNYGTSQYNISGNISFTVVPSSKGIAFMTLLTQKGFQPNLSVSAYNNSGNGCPVESNAAPAAAPVSKE